MNRWSEEMDRRYAELRQKFQEIGILIEKIRSKFQAIEGLDNNPSRRSAATSTTRTAVPPG